MVKSIGTLATDKVYIDNTVYLFTVERFILYERLIL